MFPRAPLCLGPAEHGDIAPALIVEMFDMPLPTTAAIFKDRHPALKPTGDRAIASLAALQARGLLEVLHRGHFADVLAYPPPAPHWQPMGMNAKARGVVP